MTSFWLRGGMRLAWIALLAVLVWQTAALAALGPAPPPTADTAPGAESPLKEVWIEQKLDALLPLDTPVRTEEALDVQAFRSTTIPWDELAFWSDDRALRDYLSLTAASAGAGSS